MPRGDGTGPAGMGPMTGRAAGYCAGYSAPGFTNPIPGRGYFGYGLGLGRGRGRFWRGQAYPYTPYPTYSPSYYSQPYAQTFGYSQPAPQDELQMLKAQADALKSEMDAIKTRMDELRKQEQKK
ncbi:DUF5320 domain-containing protein [candidate division WOR-3 bacterium]|nr:DUF5320 domain-containing protein [candidate division WOR-3 bacterium]